MRIALLTMQWPGARLGGIGAYTLRCATALATAGHEPHLFTLTLPADARRGLPGGIILHEVEDLATRVNAGKISGAAAARLLAGGECPYRFALAGFLCNAVRDAHKNMPLDLVEGPEYEALGLPLLLDPIADLPVVTHLHSGSAIRRMGNGQAAAPDDALSERFEFAAILAADALCAPSHAVLADTRRLCPFQQQAQVIGLPFAADGAAEFSPPPVDGPILYVGRLEQMKGMEILAGALNAVLRASPSMRVRIVGPDTATAPGNGSMAEWMRGQIDAELQSRVTFTGERIAADLAAEYRNAAFCVVPSLFESYSYVACEALAAGRAVMVSSGIGAAEVVGDAGIPFPRGDSPSLAAAMLGLAHDRSLLESLSRRAFQRARKILSNTLPQRLDFYSQVIQNFKPRGRPAILKNFPSIPSLTQSLEISSSAQPTPGSRLLTIMNQLSTETGERARVLLYGAGRHSARLLAEKQIWEDAGHRVVGLIDDHPRFNADPVAWGLPVQSLSSLPGRQAGPAVVLSTDTFQDQFWKQTEPLRAAGWRVYRLYEP